jgi:transcriptional regulator with XRE-family HTH domain
VRAKSILRGLGEEIRRRRISLKLSQLALAQDAGVHLNTIGKLERGIYNPTVLLLDAIATKLKVSLQDLFAGAAQRE